MPRPGLAAARSIDIIEFLALFPDQRFTLSEIARATNINVASCFAILNRLTERGYLNRASDGKSYSLGPSLIAVGQAAYKSDPIVARARDVAQNLLSELGAPVLLSTVVGGEILAVFAMEDVAGRHPGMWVGERLPLVAPVGAPFLAWASNEEINAWINKREARPTPALLDEWRRDLELTRSRGYQVTMRGRDERTIAALMSEMASGRGAGADYKNQVSRLINSFENHKSQPQTIVESELYEVSLISSPIFDVEGHVAFNLGLGGFSQKLSGATIIHYADRLMHACLDIMRANRSKSRLARLARPQQSAVVTPVKKPVTKGKATPNARITRARKSRPS